MNVHFYRNPRCGRTVSAALVSTLCMASVALADLRQDAGIAINSIRRSSLAAKMPDQMTSLNAIFALAEQHYKTNDIAASEQYYRLTIQKARLLTSESVDLQPPENPQRPPSPLPSDDPHDRTAAASTAIDRSDTRLPPDSGEAVSDRIVGTASTYSVAKGESIRLIAAKLGVNRQHLATMNNLEIKAPLKPGQKLKYNNRKIIPVQAREGIIVNIPDRTLYHFRKGKLVRSLPVALGAVAKNDRYDWRTPVGKFRIVDKQKDPTWYVPSSIQAEMEENGKEAVISIPPGPDNPLGKFALKTSLPGILIHSTTKPWSIYSFASHGCIRVHPDHIEDFFREVRVNTPGEIIYQPVKLAVTEDGRVFLEVHRDAYSKSSDLEEEARILVEKNQIAGRIDWRKFETVIRQKHGIAEDITM